jgi:transcriptional regulator GlxA family with amidase domain
MTEVTILFLDGTFSSTAVGPMEVFRHAGTLWNFLTEKRQVPRFHVTTASVDGRAVRCDGSIYIQPDVAITAIRRTGLIFIPTTGLSIDDVVERNAPVVPWLRRWHKRGVAIASVCSGVGLVAATGLLDGKRATTHWGLAERFRTKYPKVRWMPELMVTEDRGFYCGGGVHAALDLSLYLVRNSAATKLPCRPRKRCSSRPHARGRPGSPSSL